MQIRHFRHFRQNPFFSWRDKSTVYQKHRFRNPDYDVQKHRFEKPPFSQPRQYSPHSQKRAWYIQTFETRYEGSFSPLGQSALIDASLWRNPLRNSFRLEWRLKSLSGHVRPRQGTEICNFGEVSPLDFLNCFPFSPGFLCSLVRKWPQNVEKVARFPGGEKSAEPCHVFGTKNRPKFDPNSTKNRLNLS